MSEDRYSAAGADTAQEGSSGSPERAVRVLVITQNCPLPSDRRVRNELAALHSAGYELVAISPEGNGQNAGSFARFEGVDIFRYVPSHASGSALSYLREYATAFWRIRRLARKVAGDRGFEVVQVSNPPDFLLLAVLFTRHLHHALHGASDHHDLAPELYLARFGSRSPPLYWLALAFERLSYMLADVVIATNESYRLVALRRGHKRPQDVYVVRSGPLLEQFTPVPADPTLKRGRAHLISFIGEMAPQDGLDHAIRALAHLRELREDWRAVLAGDGPALESLRRLSDELGLGDHVEFAGWLDDDELRTLLCSSDVCLAPDPKTPLSDASTLVKIAEYMAMSRPIVAYDLTETRVTADGAAVYAGDNDPHAFARAIAELLDDPERRERLGRIGRERVEQGLSWEHSRVALLAAYEAMLERPHARGARPRGLRQALARHLG